MTKLTNNKVLLFFILTAFFAVQWGNAHYHLAAHHDHDGSHHHHQASGHLHQFESHHAAVIDSAHEIELQKIVELDQECNASFGKNLLNLPGLAANTWSLLPVSSNTTNIRLPVINCNLQSFSLYSHLAVRAPPYYS